MSAEVYAVFILALNFTSFYCFTIYFRNTSLLHHVAICFLSMVATGTWVYVNFVMGLVPIFWQGFNDSRTHNDLWRGLFLGWWIWFLLIMTATGITALASTLTLLQNYEERKQFRNKTRA